MKSYFACYVRNMNRAAIEPMELLSRCCHSTTMITAKTRWPARLTSKMARVSCTEMTALTPVWDLMAVIE